MAEVKEEGAPEGPKPAAPNPLIYEQIEQSADYYHPGIYAALLSYYPNLQLQDDSLSTQFIPLTAFKDNRKNSSKQFVIGVIPPTANVTGKLLDRSSSIATGPEGVVPEVWVSEDQTARVEDIQPPPDTTQRANNKTSWGVEGGVDAIGQEFWVDYVSMCQRLRVDPIELGAIMYNESGFNPGAEARSSISSEGTAKAKGLIQNLRSGMVPRYMTDEQWEEYSNLSGSEQLYFVERFLRAQRIAGKKGADLYVSGVFGQGYSGTNPDGAIYMSAAAQEKWLQEFIAAQDPPFSPEQIANLRATRFTRREFQAGAYELNAYLDKDKDGMITYGDMTQVLAGKPPEAYKRAIEQALALAPSSPIGNPFGGDGARKPWKDDGSEAAKEIRAQLEKIAKTGLNATGLGQQYQNAQRAQILATQEALDKMSRVPPLRMLINPKSFSVKGEKITQDGNWGRNGPIIEHWGDNQDKISGSGSIAGFYSLYGALPASQTGAGGPGLTRMARNFSSSYQNFMSLYLLYRNNAAIFLPDPTQPDLRPNLSLLGSVYLYYDNILYIGSFDSFNITEDDTKPFTLDYSFEFTVRACFLLDRPTEQGFAYGAPAIVPQSGERPPQAGGDLLGAQTTTTAAVPPATPPPSMTADEVAAERQRIENKFQNGGFTREEADVALAALERETGPQRPGNEPGAVLRKNQLIAEMGRLEKNFQNGQIDDTYYYKRLGEIQAELARLQ